MSRKSILCLLGFHKGKEEECVDYCGIIDHVKFCPRCNTYLIFEPHLGLLGGGTWVRIPKSKYSQIKELQ